MFAKAVQSLLAAWRQPRWRAALILALLSDAASFGLAVAGPFQVAGDLVTALALFAVLGFRWPLFIPLVSEAIPAVALFPAWTFFVGAMAMAGGRPPARPKVVSVPSSPSPPES
jgi:hypothetical protein